MLADGLQNNKKAEAEAGDVITISTPAVLDDAGEKNGLVNIERFVQRLRMTAH